MRALVIGNKGSIGKRHAKNLTSLGVEVANCDLGDAPTNLVDFAVICSPTSTHLSWIQWCNHNGIPFLCEKPVGGSSHDLDLIDSLNIKVPHMVACNLRFSSSMTVIKQFIEQNEVVSFHARISDGNQARKKYAEGIAVQDIHEFDYLSWLFGGIDEILLSPSHNMNSYEALLKMKDGVQGTVHGDCLSEYNRELTLTSKLRTLRVPIDIGNSMYMDELQDFIYCLKTGTKPMNPISEASALTRTLCEEYEFCQK